MASDHDMYAIGIDAAVRADNPDKLRAYLAMAGTSEGMNKHRLYHAIAARGEGVSSKLAGDHDAASDQLEIALQGFRELETSWQIGRTLLELGEVEGAREHPEAASVHFTEALGVFEALGAIPDADRARNALESLA